MSGNKGTLCRMLSVSFLGCPNEPHCLKENTAIFFLSDFYISECIQTTLHNKTEKGKKSNLANFNAKIVCRWKNIFDIFIFLCLLVIPAMSQCHSGHSAWRVNRRGVFLISSAQC